MNKNTIITYERSNGSWVIEQKRKNGSKLWGIIQRDGTITPNLGHELKELTTLVEKARKKGLIP